MCAVVIVDTNMFPDVFRGAGEGAKELRDWITAGHGILAFSDASNDASRRGLSRQEYTDRLRVFAEYAAAGVARSFDVGAAGDRLENRPIRSDDHHLLALALVSRASILCTDDRAFRQDFLDVKVLPKVGRQTRAVYPVAADRKTRREFLERRKCPKRRYDLGR